MRRPLAPLDFTVWHGWMDALGHVNHPLYVDWCDEALRRAVAAGGGDPQGLDAVGERARFRTAALGGHTVSVSTTVTGTTGAQVHTRHVARRTNDGVVLAELELVRQMGDGGPPLPALLGLP
jgi:acyl-CoA thioesterase FadM